MKINGYGSHQSENILILFMRKRCTSYTDSSGTFSPYSLGSTLKGKNFLFKDKFFPFLRNPIFPSDTVSTFEEEYNKDVKKNDMENRKMSG